MKNISIFFFFTIGILNAYRFLPHQNIKANTFTSRSCVDTTIKGSTKDSLESRLYDYYDVLYNTEQYENQKNVVSESLRVSKLALETDSLQLQKKLTGFLIDSSFLIKDTLKWIALIKDYAEISVKTLKKDSGLTKKQDSIINLALKICKKNNKSKIDIEKTLKNQFEDYYVSHIKLIASKNLYNTQLANSTQADYSFSLDIKKRDSLNIILEKEVLPKLAGFFPVDSGSIQSHIYKKKKYLVYKFNTNQDSLELSVLPNKSKSGRTIKLAWDQLTAQKRKPVFIMNAGMFNETYAAQGLLIESGVTINYLDTNITKGKSGNFYMQPNGIFFINGEGKFQIETTSEFINKQNTKNKTDTGIKKKILFATQSGPMLVINNTIHKAFNPRSSNFNIRNGIGIRNVKEGQQIFLVVSEEQVNFHEFASFYKDVLHCENALYLDGFVSRAYMQSGNKKMGVLDNKMGLGPLFIICKKKK